LTPRASAALLAVLLRTGSPRSAFRAVFFEIPAAAARSRFVIPCSSRKALTFSEYRDNVIYGEGGADALYGGPGSALITSTGDNADDFVDCGGGADIVEESGASDRKLDRFVNCERFVN
jgi:hypothetical protein